MRKIIIGSRGSDLALWQANFVQSRLQELSVESEIKIISTQGDRIQNLSFDKLEGKGFFTKEIEQALLDKMIDLAVHSHKDLETNQPKGLAIGAVSKRANPADVLLIAKSAVDIRQKFNLKKSAIVGTSSARRKNQLKLFRPDIELEDLRGNVPTRIDKLRKGNYDAIVLAQAGVSRLNLDLSEFHGEILDPKEFIPAPAQGVLALQIREDDHELNKILSQLNDIEVQQCVEVERKVLNLFNGGCQLPLGVYCELDDDEETYKVWCSKADNWKESPVLFYLEGRDRETLIPRLVNKINDHQSTSVFITRNLTENDLLYRSLGNKGYQLFGRALIEIKRIPIKKVPQADWIFFSSKNAVKHFFGQNPEIKEGVKYGVIGKGTSEALRKFGHRPDFIGSSTNTKMTGKQFANKVGRDVVLFPQAKGSFQTVQHQLLSKDQVKNLLVYESISHNEEAIPETDIIFFTSPSNVEAFFKKNRLSKSQRVVAMGNATANALQKHRVISYIMPDAFDEVAMARAVFRA